MPSHISKRLRLWRQTPKQPRMLIRSSRFSDDANATRVRPAVSRKLRFGRTGQQTLVGLCRLFRDERPRLLAEVHLTHTLGELLTQRLVLSELDQGTGKLMRVLWIHQQRILSVGKQLPKHRQIACNNGFAQGQARRKRSAGSNRPIRINDNIRSSVEGY